MTIELFTQRSLFVLTAPSGGGKTTICRALLAADTELAYSLSTTTRPARVDEKDGAAYNFVDIATFRDLEKRNIFVESAVVHGHCYGTRKDLIQILLDEGRDVVMDLDVQGAFSIRGAMANVILIFILPPSMAVLESRLRARASDDDAVIARRLENARNEIAQARAFDYTVVNTDLEDTIQRIRSIIQAERLRSTRQRIVCEGEGPLDTFYPAGSGHGSKK